MMERFKKRRQGRFFLRFPFLCDFAMPIIRETVVPESYFNFTRASLYEVGNCYWCIYISVLITRIRGEKICRKGRGKVGL